MKCSMRSSIKETGTSDVATVKAMTSLIREERYWSRIKKKNKYIHINTHIHLPLWLLFIVYINCHHGNGSLFLCGWVFLVLVRTEVWEQMLGKNRNWENEKGQTVDYVLCKRHSDFLYLVTCCLFSPFSKDSCSLDRESSIFISFMIEVYFSQDHS